MTLNDLATSHKSVSNLRVPVWALGTVKRRSITLATGFSDAETNVVWVQAHGMTGDIRIHPARPKLRHGDRLEDLGHDMLAMLASVEGGTATTSWSHGVMSWSDWIGFQPYDKYPEPGIMHRIGDCMIEFAPSGIYVEDWRFQPSAPGLLAGLRLICDIGHDGRQTQRAGGLVIAGDHAICSLARRQELADGTRAQDYVRTHPDPLAALQRVMDCTVDYAVRSGETFTIVHSTDPRREGQAAPFTSAFEADSVPGIVRQTLDGDPDVCCRLWRIDSLEAGVTFAMATPATPDRLAWLQAESDTLIAPLLKPSNGEPLCA